MCTLNLAPNFTQVKNNKLRDTEAADRAMKAKQIAEEKAEEEGSGPADILGEQEDQDVIF